MNCTYPTVMGILNATPDSFFAGSRKQSEKEIAERACQIIAEGASMIDVGACSTRPGSAPVSGEEEMQRMHRCLAIVRREQPDAVLSIDTFRPEVARMAVEEFGADVINDVSGGTQEMFQAVAEMKVPYVMMSTAPTIETIKEQFQSAIDALAALGHKDIILDPGYGFGKDVISGNYGVLGRQQELKDAFPEMPLLVGVSRKRMVWQLFGTSPDEALNGTTAINMLALERGADILRVHDVKEAVEAVKIYELCLISR